MNDASPERRLAALSQRWEAAFPDALAAWSRFTRLRPPLLCVTVEEAKRQGLTGSFAMIRLTDQAIVVNLPAVLSSRVQDFPVEILAHEIGHHVLAPANLTDHGRMMARMRRALPTVTQHAPMLANLYTDLLINDRLQRSAGLRMADVYRALANGDAAALADVEAAGASKRRPLKARSPGAVWTLYLRICEILWKEPRGALGAGKVDDRLEGDAVLGARLIRSYASDIVGGSGRFATLFLPHLLEDTGSLAAIERLLDTQGAGEGGDATGLTDVDPDEATGAIHPAEDPLLSDEIDAEDQEESGVSDGTVPAVTSARRAAAGQTRQPFEYGELLRALGMKLTDHEAAVRFYREKALPHLVPFPSRPSPRSADPLPEGLEPWDIGHSLDAVDWLESVLVSPRVVPGMTTVQRTIGTTEGRAPARVPLDLDLYVDSSGSMTNPQQLMSFPALAGAIICLSAFRAGARVQATLWSGARQFESTPGFVRDEMAVLRVLTGYIGGATAFPIHVLRRTFERRKTTDRPAHVLVVSDDGASTMFDGDERGQAGWDVVRAALARARGGGTLVLNLPSNWDSARHAGYAGDALGALRRARDEMGWHVHRVASWEDLVAFAREFSRARYGGGAP